MRRGARAARRCGCYLWGTAQGERRAGEGASAAAVAASAMAVPAAATPPYAMLPLLASAIWRRAV